MVLKTDKIKITVPKSFDELDKFVWNNPFGCIFQTPDIVAVYNRTKNCEPVVLVATDESELLASLVAIKFVEKSGLFKLFSTHATIRGGPIFTDDFSGRDAATLLLNHFHHTVASKLLYTRIYPFFETPGFAKILTDAGYKYEDWLNFIINLTTEKKVWSCFSSSRKKGIKKAERSGVVIEELHDRKGLTIFYKLLTETHSAAKLPLADISLFDAVFELLVPKKKAKFFLATYRNKYVACRLVLLYKTTIYDWYAGCTEDAFLCRANELLVWRILKFGCENGYKRFDFGGAGLPGEDYGVREFKRRFGGRLVNYGRYTKIYAPVRLWLAEKMFKIYKKYL